MPGRGVASGGDLRTLLARAVAAHRAGGLSEAERLYDLVLAADPCHGWASYFRGVLAQEAGELEAARALYRTACSSPDAAPQFLVTLGNLDLSRGDAANASASFRSAIAKRPDFAAAHTGMSLALKQLGQLEAAAESASRAVQLRRGWAMGGQSAGLVDPTEAAALRRANRVKLRHDSAQLRYLRQLGRVGSEIDAVIAGLETLLARYAALPDDVSIVELSDADLTLTRYAYNRAIHIAPAPRLPAPALNAGAFASADAPCVSSPTGFAVVDSALTPAALGSLQRLLTESTIWFEVKDHGGHLGAYFEEGLACGLMAQITEEVRALLPRTLGEKRLAQLWAYKYQQGMGGTELHADVGAVSLNLWVTPDTANLDPQGGGLEILPLVLPPDWDFQRMNVERDTLRRFAAASGTAPVQIPYRCNRMVVFGARLLHRTAPGHFADGYINRRTNVTFLFA
jgi:tetratricopeptide (TPR) repeat protein